MALAYLDVARAVKVARDRSTGPDDDEANDLMDEMSSRKLAMEPDQQRFRELCDRWDNLYYPQNFTRGGASHWATHESARLPARSHVSVNVYPVYVDTPASLLSVQPVENMVALGTSEGERTIAAAIERVYMAWKDEVDFELTCHKGAVTKSLYGRTAAKVYWSDDLKRPTFEIVDQPRNLYLGWRDTNYLKLEWALYCYAITPDTAMEDWGLVTMEGTDEDGKPYPYIVNPGTFGTFIDHNRARLDVSADLRVEVYDYWYRRPAKNAKPRFGKPTKFETWNAIFVGNQLVKNEMHREYKGELPYIPVYNSYVPGVPDGRSNLYDIEQLVREKDERLSETAQMISRGVNGQMWQLTGVEAPPTVPAGLKPTPNNVVAPGAGNRLEKIEPWMPEFQVEQYLARIDRELNDVSGLNDLLRGMAPQQTLNSGKAISALVANYETRITMSRDLWYQWRSDVWTLAKTIWGEKVTEMRPIFESRIKLVIASPTLTPRDDAEMSTIAGNLKELKLWSGKRAMDRVGVDDPETEEDIIRAEQTDATLNPAQVQVMVSLMMMMQQMQQSQQQMGPQVQAQQQAAGSSIEQSMAAMRGLSPDVSGQEQMQEEGEQPVTPAEQMPGNMSEEAVAEGEPGAVPPTGEVLPSQMLSQYQIEEGEANSRIVGQSTIQKTE